MVYFVRRSALGTRFIHSHQQAAKPISQPTGPVQAAKPISQPTGTGNIVV